MEEERERKRDCFEPDTMGLVELTATTVPFTNTGTHSSGGNTKTNHSWCLIVSEPFFRCTHLLHEKLVSSESFLLKMSAVRFWFTPKHHKAQCSNRDDIFDNG